MARSKHTDPRELRAARRLQAPRQERGADDASRRRRRGRNLKELGVAVLPADRRAPGRPARVRIVVRRARPGFHHPADEEDVRQFLETVGPVARYGLRAIELLRAPTARSLPPGGRYFAPGRIVLYEQPVGDGIENPGNALTMLHAAGMFAVACRFRNTKGLARASEFAGAARSLPAISAGDVGALHARRIAFDNLPGAADVYGFRAGSDFAGLVGNERRGLSHELTTLATDRVQVPMESRRINCLNVAAASAVALYYLCGPPVGPAVARRDPWSRRPELLLAGAGDHIELGSTIRSAAAFGWERAFVEDRDGVWFGCDRIVRSEGRAAARRGRNAILLVPCPATATHRYPRVTVITRRPLGVPLHRASLAGGSRQLVVIPDEGRIEAAAEDWSRCGDTVEFVHLPLPAADFIYHYRLVSTVALAEISRQVGRRPAAKPARAPRPPVYEHALGPLAEAPGEIVTLEELSGY
jgi:hypothetical protein